MSAVKHKTSNQIRFSGVGGSQMKKQGLNSQFPMSELTIMGLAEVIPRLPNLLMRINKTVKHILMSEPDVLLTIDSPDFNLRVIKRLRPTNIKIIHYVAPSVWAWKPGRAGKLAELADHLLTLLPFEPPYFEPLGLESTFVGHSVIESKIEKGNGIKFRERYNIPLKAKVLCLLPGSRFSEINRLLPIYEDLITLLNESDLVLLIPTVEHFADEIRLRTLGWSNVPKIICVEEEKFSAFAASNAAVAASGTVSLELALAKVPYVTVYKFNFLTALIAQYMVKTPFVNIINILLKREAVPELIQSDCKSDKIAKYISKYLNGSAASQIEGFEEAIDLLRFKDEMPSDRAANVVLDLIKCQR
jgi:lipid-A-disaccharide synthase